MEPTLTERLVNRLAGRRTSRRGFLAAATVGGAALATNPWSYLTRPQDAYAAVCGPGNECNEGWSVMCCTIHDGKNTCCASRTSLSVSRQAASSSDKPSSRS